MASIQLQGDNSGSLTIQAPSDAGNHTLTLPATTHTLATQNALGVRNLIINGDMNIAQRGTSSTSVTASGYKTCDRWQSVYSASGAGTWTHTKDTDVPTGQGFSKSYKLSCTTANASLSSTESFIFRQRLEGQMLQHLKKGTSSAEKLTLSFWVKSNKTGTYIVELYDRDNTRQLSKAYTIDTADTWEKKTVTYDSDTTGALDSDNNVSLDVQFWLVAGPDWTSGTLDTTWGNHSIANRVAGQVNLADSTSNYINITGIQLEVGTEATPFEHRPYDMELQRCMRYFENLQLVYPGIHGVNYGSSSGASIQFKVQKRVVPSITDATVRNGASGATASVTASTNWTTLCACRFPYTGLTGTAGAGQSVHVYETNGIHVDAEL